ncbi:MAG: alkaline phosphatase family protein [Tissierellales bacterium]
MLKKSLVFSLIIILIFFLSSMYLSKQIVDDIPVIKATEGEDHNFAIYTGDGDIIYTQSIDEIKRSLLNNVVVKAGSFVTSNPIGIIENSPKERITDIKNLVLKSLDKENKVLIIYIDGLGYELYEKAIYQGNVPYIASLNRGIRALTVYPPITNVAFAAMVTGETPKYTGIQSRDKKPLLAPTIFDAASKKGKTSKIIEGNIRILTSDVETILNIDENNDGTIDDEIYRSALEELKNPPHILLVHFHSYDDMGHRYGPSSKEALEQLKVLDLYIEDITKNFIGDIIITSDHGMHDEEGGGSHGNFLPMDLFIPIILENHK